MHLKTLKVRNFRALEDIHVEFDKKVSVIVGPNAAGKTTILEAIRLLKAILLPRTQNEAGQVLQSLGAASPHIPNRLQMRAIAQDVAKEIVIGCRFGLSETEIAAIVQAGDAIATSIVQSQTGQAFAAPDALIGFLSSPQGKSLFQEAKTRVETGIESVQKEKHLYLELTFFPNGNVRASSDQIEIQLAAFLDRRLPPYKASFTYFPADRALPAGEQPVQLGGPDAAQQLESYNSQPQTKFNRLKNTIFSASIIGETQASADTLKSQFEKIFKGILKGRELFQFGVNEIGLLSVLIKDTETGKIFDLDGMSSGEKGLILTFLLIAQSVIEDGIVLLDEPELHLNPAVCKDLLAFLVDEYVKPRNLQVLVCSHSPEILAGAFESDDCALYHLISSRTISKVRPQDEATLSDALRRLGAVESENLLYRGIIFVEGPDDVALIEAGFAALLRRYKVKFSAGRKEIEKAVHALQEAEKAGVTTSPTYFVFDKDDEPTSLVNSTSVRVLQWNRRCFENYLLDVDAIANLLMDDEITRQPYSNIGDVERILREIAYRQLTEVAAKKVYGRYVFEGLGLRKEDLLNQQVKDISKRLLSRIDLVKQQVAAIDSQSWPAEFEAQVEEERKKLEVNWESNWQIECDGKRLLEDLSRTVQLKVKLKRFKVRLMKEILLNQSRSWQDAESQLKLLIGSV